MGFPPGLLPELVKEHLRTEENYEPLSKKDVDRAGVPHASTPDPYLLARLEKFYAELQVRTQTFLHSLKELSLTEHLQLYH